MGGFGCWAMGKSVTGWMESLGAAKVVASSQAEGVGMAGDKVTAGLRKLGGDF
jgi:hypothetical protein